VNARALITVAIALVVLSPVARRRGWDDFPISSYPMFSRGDLGGAQSLAHVLIVHADGRRTPAPPSIVGSPEPMVVLSIVAQAVRNGTARELCTAVAARVRDADAVSVEVVVSAFDAMKYFRDGKRAPESRQVHASCRIPR
jgi:hypothetical protein